MNRSIKIFLLINVVIFTVSCNPTKLVPKGDALYTGATIKVKDSTLSNKQKKNVIALASQIPKPRPNSKFLGMRIKLFIYNLAGDTSKHNFIRKFLRKTGEPPVLLSRVNLDYNVRTLQNFMDNRGYFQVETRADTVVKKRKGHAFYTINPGPVYSIKQVSFETDSSSLGTAIQATRPGTILHPGY